MSLPALVPAQQPPSSPNAQEWSVAMPVNDTALTDSADEAHPSVCSDGQNGWVAVWETTASLGSAPGDWDIALARSTDGQSWTSSTLLSGGANAEQIDDLSPKVALGTSSTLVVVWSAKVSDSDHEIYFARSADGGKSWSAGAPLTSSADNSLRDDMHPTLAAGQADTWVVTWERKNELGGWDIYFSRSTDNGLSWSVPAQLLQYYGHTSGISCNCQLATDGQGIWMAIWTGSGQYEVPDSNGLLCQSLLISRSTDNGLTWSKPALLVDNTDSYRRKASVLSPRIVSDRHGNWIIVYTLYDEQQAYRWRLWYTATSGNGEDWFSTVSTDPYGGQATEAHFDYLPVYSNGGPVAGDVVSYGKASWLVVTSGLDQSTKAFLNVNNGWSNHDYSHETWMNLYTTDFDPSSLDFSLASSSSNKFLMGFTSKYLPSQGVNDTDIFASQLCEQWFDLQIRREVPPVVGVGDPFRYSLLVTNNGNAVAPNVLATDTLPPHCEVRWIVTESSYAYPVFQGNTASTKVGHLGPGNTARIDFALQVYTTGTIETEAPAIVSSSLEDRNPSDNQTTTPLKIEVVDPPDLSVSITQSPEIAHAITPISYEVKVTNNSPIDAYNVIAYDKLPSGMVFVGASASQGQVYVEQAANQAQVSLGTLGAGKSATLNVQAAAIIAGVYETTGSVTLSQADPRPENNKTSIQTTVAGEGTVELAGRWGQISSQCKTARRGVNCTLRATLSFTNFGLADASSSTIAFYLSDDAKLDASDQLIRRMPAGKLRAGQTAQKTVTARFNQNVAGKYLIAVLDEANSVKEVNEANNTVVGQIGN